MPAPIVNGGGDRLGKVQYRNFRGPVTLTSNQVIQHTVVHRSSTSMYTPNFIGIGKTLWTDERTDIPTDGHFRPSLMLLGRLGGDDLKRLHHHQTWTVQLYLQGDSNVHPHLKHTSLGPAQLSPKPKRHLSQFSHFCRAHDRDRQTTLLHP